MNKECEEAWTKFAAVELLYVDHYTYRAFEAGYYAGFRHAAEQPERDMTPFRKMVRGLAEKRKGIPAKLQAMSGVPSIVGAQQELDLLRTERDVLAMVVRELQEQIAEYPEPCPNCGRPNLCKASGGHSWCMNCRWECDE